MTALRAAKLSELQSNKRHTLEQSRRFSAAKTKVLPDSFTPRT